MNNPTMAQTPARNSQISKAELQQYFRDRRIESSEISGQIFVELDVQTLSKTLYRLRLCIPEDYPNSDPFLAVVHPPELHQHNGTILPPNDAQFLTHGKTDDGFQIISLLRLMPNTNASFFVHQIFAKGKLWVTAYEEHRATGENIAHYIHEYRLAENEIASKPIPFWSETQVRRLEQEKQLLNEYFRSGQVKWSREQRAFDVTVKSMQEKETYIFRVYLRHDYPNSCPVLALVYPDELLQLNGEPVPESSEEFHTQGKKDGHLTICHYRQNEWFDSYSVAGIVNLKALPWVNAYEQYKLQRNMSFNACLRQLSQESTQDEN